MTLNEDPEHQYLCDVRTIEVSLLRRLLLSFKKPRCSILNRREELNTGENKKPCGMIDEG